VNFVKWYLQGVYEEFCGVVHSGVYDEFCEVVPSGGVRRIRTKDITVYKIPCHNSDCYGKLLRLVFHVL